MVQSMELYSAVWIVAAREERCHMRGNEAHGCRQIGAKGSPKARTLRRASAVVALSGILIYSARPEHSGHSYGSLGEEWQGRERTFHLIESRIYNLGQHFRSSQMGVGHR